MTASSLVSEEIKAEPSGSSSSTVNSSASVACHDGYAATEWRASARSSSRSKAGESGGGPFFARPRRFGSFSGRRSRAFSCDQVESRPENIASSNASFAASNSSPSASSQVAMRQVSSFSGRKAQTTAVSFVPCQYSTSRKPRGIWRGRSGSSATSTGERSSTARRRRSRSSRLTGPAERTYSARVDTEDSEISCGGHSRRAEQTNTRPSSSSQRPSTARDDQRSRRSKRSSR